MKKIIITTYLLCILLVVFPFYPTIALAQENVEENPVDIYFFWGDGCPHCAAEKPFLEALETKYAPHVKVNAYEIYYVKENQILFQTFGEALNFEPQAVPTTIVGDQYWVGFSEEIQAEIEIAVQTCLEERCEFNPGQEVISEKTDAEPQQEQSAETEPFQKISSEQTITIPFIGTIDLEKQSLFVSTAIIGFVDGFNPCSLWVLAILLTITLHSGSRAKTLVVGLTFLITTAIIYSLFIAGVFTIFSYVGYLKWIQVIVALIALVFGIVNLKDYFWYKEGISFTISDKHKPKMYQNMRSTVTTPRSMVGLISSTAVMAVGVSLMEFACTAGFPVIWSNLMLSNNVSTTTFIVLLAVYMLIYLIDELFIFGSAVATMKASRIEEKHGRILKLISGTVILTLSVVMLVDPELMNNLGTSLVVFSASLAGAGVIYFVHQNILPKFGIFIGTGIAEKDKKKKHQKSKK